MAEWVEKGSLKGPPGDSTGVPDGGTPGQLLSKTDSGTAWVDPPSTGNVLTGEADGYVAHGEDAYAQKPIEMRVKGKTWVNRWPAINRKTSGVTVSTSEDGMITLSGTASAAFVASANIQGVSPNKQITVVPSKQIGTGASTAGLCIRFLDSDGANIDSVNAIGFQNSNPVTLTTPTNMASMDASVVVYEGQTINASFRVMLVDGTEAPDCFTPCASITSAQPGNLVTAGKNLLPESNENVQPIHLEPGTYVFSADFDSDGGEWYLHSPDDMFDENTPTLLDGKSFTIPYAGNWIIHKYGIVASNAQLELGSTATSYEPPSITQTPLPEVELRSLPNGTCDELVIKEDGTCEVERRTGYIASYADEEVTGEYVSTGNGLEAGASIVYELDEPTTEPQSPVALPAMPAPTFNQYHDSPVPSDTSTEYVRDINIAFDNLAKQVAGAASAVAVHEASTIEEE